MSTRIRTSCLLDPFTSDTWEGEKILPSKYANDLQQFDNGVKIPSKGWKCEKCDMTSNLWLNLTDGKILCGRRYFDGSGGNNHALEYFMENDYPLVRHGMLLLERDFVRKRMYSLHSRLSSLEQSHLTVKPMYSAILRTI